MDILTKELGLTRGLGVGIRQHTSDLFLRLHYLAKSIAAKKPVVLVSGKDSALTYRLACSKQAIRWDPSLIHVVELADVFGDQLQPSCDIVFTAIENKIRETGASSVIFDDVSLFERLGFSAASLVLFIFSLWETLPEDALVYTSFAMESTAFKMLSTRADFVMSFEPIGSGFGKDVSGKISISMRSSCALPQRKELLFLTGDRSMKCFYPGSLPLQL